MLYNAAVNSAEQLALLPDDTFAAYQGKWVAVVRGHVVAAGETADSARSLARRTCPRDEPVVLYVPADGVRVRP